MSNRPISPGSITQVAGIEVGHFTSPLRPTGCTVVIAREGAVAGVDVAARPPARAKPICWSPRTWSTASMP